MASTRLLTKILADFLFGFYLLNYVFKPRNKPYTNTLAIILMQISNEILFSFSYNNII
jgi:hypothetical protein